MKISSILVVMVVSLASVAQAAEVTAVNTLMRGTVISPRDIQVIAGYNENADAISAAYIGMQTNRTVYAGQALTIASLEPPVLVKRNAVVTMTYKVGALSITTYGRALGEGAEGDIIDVMNVDSRMKIKAVVTGPDMVKVR